MMDSEMNEQLKTTVTYIRGLLAEEAGTIIDESDSEDLTSMAFKNSITDESFHTFTPSSNAFKLAAVDGGSQRIMNAGSFIIGGYRASKLIFNGPELVSPGSSPPVKIQSISFANRKEIYSKIFKDLIGEEPNEYPRELMLVLQRLRAFEEWSVAQNLIQQLEEGDIILIDGSLKASINKQDILFQRVLGLALEKGIHFVGISKRSTLRFNHAPLLQYIKRKGEAVVGKDKTWYCEIPDEKGHSQLFGKRYIVKFHPSTTFAFRTDINRYDEVAPDMLFGKIAQFCSDPSYLGYPYPLAHIHNLVVINRSLMDDISYRLEAIALEQGVASCNWYDMFSNFHDILDKNR